MTLFYHGFSLQRRGLTFDRNCHRIVWYGTKAGEMALPNGTVTVAYIYTCLPYLATMSGEEMLGAIQLTKAICDLQQDFSRRVVESLAALNFEVELRRLPDSQRRELILEGICRASVCGGRDLEQRRMWCPEITVSGLGEQLGASL